MCGLAGLLGLDGALAPPLKAAIRPMTDALAHRGPDGSGFFADERVALGHRRLAIIDRARGHQPMPNEDDTCWVVFNGEVYNHADVRRDLEAKGHRFRTRSDTEAIVHAFEEYGADCVERLEGMFAFAAYDSRTGDLLLARDRLGKKPLLYAVLGGVLHFGSEIAALQQSPAWDGTLDVEQLEAYLSLGYFLAPGSAYRHVRKLEPGHLLYVRNGQIQNRQYWDVTRFDDWEGSEDEAVRLVESELRGRVRERLESEVPLGAFLSGGIDSGLVVSFMAEAHDREVVTTSVGFGESSHNELALAGVTAHHCQTTHHPHVIAPSLHEAFDSMISGLGEPMADASCLPTWYVSREARRHVTVALSGDGGDETFGGYTFRYLPHAFEQRVREGIGSRAARRVIGRVGAGWPRGRRVPRPLRLGTMLENVGWDAEAAYYADLCFLKPSEARLLMGRAPIRDPRASVVYDAVVAPYRRCGSKNVVQRAEYADLKIYLANDVLVKVDRMSMQHSLEVRSPLLDRRLVELAFRLPMRLKRADQTGKHLLKRVAARRLPPAILEAPKRGFDAPVGAWIAGPLASAYADEVLAPRSEVAALLDRAVIRRAFDDHRAGRADRTFMLWAVWILERWLGRQRGAFARPVRESHADVGSPQVLAGARGASG
jgi:asparagine synthase (glutamine-hydrolysing)